MIKTVVLIFTPIIYMHIGKLNVALGNCMNKPCSTVWYTVIIFRKEWILGHWQLRQNLKKQVAKCD